MTRVQKYFQLVPNFPYDDGDNPWFIDFGKLYAIQGSWMKNGQIIDPLPKIDALCPRGAVHCRDYMLSLNGWSLFSDAAAQMFDEVFPGSIQFVPFRFRPRYSKEWHSGYSIGQVLHIVDAIDRTRTECADNWQPRANGSLQVRHPIWIMGTRIAGLPVFRLRGSNVQLWVNDRVRDEVAKRKLTGFRYAKAYVS